MCTPSWGFLTPEHFKIERQNGYSLMVLRLLPSFVHSLEPENAAAEIRNRKDEAEFVSVVIQIGRAHV